MHHAFTDNDLPTVLASPFGCLIDETILMITVQRR